MARRHTLDLVTACEQLGGNPTGAATDVEYAPDTVGNMAQQEIGIAFLRLRQVLDADLQIVLPQAIVQIAATEKKMKQVESGDQADFLGIYF